jgi:ActD protein
VSAEIHEQGVRGAFATIEDVVAAVRALEEEGFAPDDITVFSPIPTSEMEEHIDRPPSKVRYMTLIGGIIGCTTGLVLTQWTFHAWPLLVGGKSVTSFPVTIVPMFELTVLIGGLFTLAGILVFSQIPAFGSKPGYHPRFSDDLFGIFVHATADEGKRRAQSVLDGLGSLEIELAP